MKTNITFNDTKKDLPCNKLIHLFREAGWTNDELNPEPNSEHDANFNIGYKNSTLVISAWDGERLVGAVRVLSDTIFRSIILDLVVDSEYRKHGIGKELVSRCIAHYPDSEWSLETSENNIGFYEKIGFDRSKSVHFRIKSTYQPE